MNLVEAARKMTIGKTAVLRAVWLVVAVMTFGLLAVAVPLRYQMFLDDAYGYGAPLADIGLSLRFFAIYFTFFELLLVGGSWAVGVVIAWRKSDDWFALLTAVTLLLFGFLPPLVDGLIQASPNWQMPLVLARWLCLTGLLTVFSLFPNGRFVPRWLRFVLIGWIGNAIIVNIFWPGILADTAVLPNTGSREDALWLLFGVAWFVPIVAAQIYRYKRVSTAVERQQTKWVIFGFTITVAFSLFSAILLTGIPSLRDDPAVNTLAALTLGVIYLLAALLLPITFAFAILRYRLWQIDIILNRTLVYGGLTALVTAVYLLMIGGLGLLAAGQQWRLIGVMLATAVTAILLKPVKTSLQTHVNRLIPPPPKEAPTPTERAHHPAIPRRRGLVAGLFLLVLAVQVVLGWLTAVGCHHFSDYGLVALAVSSGSGLLFASVGGLILFHRPDNRIGWFCLWSGIGLPTVAIIELYLHCGLAGQLVAPGSAYVAWFAYSFGVGLIILPMFILLPMLYPNGQFLSPRWRNLTIVGLIAIAITSLGAGLLPDFGQINAFGASWAIANPFGVAGLPVWWYGSFRAALLLCVIALSVAGIAAMVVRWRRSVGDERQQMKWLAYFMATAVVVQLLVFELPGTLFYPELFFTIWYQLIILIVFWGYPLIIGIAVFKYRLYAIDLVINRTLVYGGLTLVVVSIYALTVGVLSLLFHTSGNLVISLIATGIIAAAFQPLRQRLQRGVNRLMFGERDDPAAVLAQLGQRLEAISQPEAVLPAIVETVAQALKLPYVAIVLEEAEERRSGGAGEQGSRGAEERVVASVGVEAEGALYSFPLVYQAEMVGRLQVTARAPGEVLSEADERVLRQVALQAGTAVHAIRLTHDLQQSRIHIVTTREEERRRLRRDLHDELGPLIASQGLKLAAVRELLTSDPATAVRLLDDVLAKNQNSVADVRRLVYNLRPPTLDELGLVGAIREYVQNSEQSGLHVTITAPPAGLPPLSAAVEAAAYRIVLEAFTNVMRHAGARRCEISLRLGTGDYPVSSPQSLILQIEDDGVGLNENGRRGVGLTSMRERAEEVGGLCEVVSSGKGVRVTAVLPVGELK